MNTSTIIFLSIFLSVTSIRYTRWKFGPKRIIPCDEMTKVPKSRIMGGEPTYIRKYPFIVSIQPRRVVTRHICGGSILTENWILTAAHCVCMKGTEKLKPASNFVVLSGLTNCRKITYWSQVSDVIAVHKHPQYLLKKVYNDIALMKLRKILVLGEAIQTTKLAPTTVMRSKDPAELWPDTCVAIGWGKMKETGPTSDVLRVVGLPLITNDRCSRLFFGGMYVRSTQICTLYMMGGRDACYGDSGGPLVCGGYQVGLTSWGKGCGKPDHPGIWTRVDMYRDWMDAVVKGAEVTPPRTMSYTIIFSVLALVLILAIIVIWLTLRTHESVKIHSIQA